MAPESTARDWKGLFERLNSSENGLSSGEARNRLEGFGPNELAVQDHRTAFSILVSQFKSPLILVLVAASLVAGFLGSPLDCAIIVGIVLLNAVLGFYQEFKSEKALAELRKFISFEAKVLRDGIETEIDVKQLVPGDLVFLEIGDIVPADIRLWHAEELTVNESAVSGESFPVHKAAEPVFLDSLSLSQQKGMVFMGTTIASGSGKGIVVSTGKNTVFGRTATVLSAKEPATDFQKNIKKFGNFLLKVIFLLTIFVFASNAFLGKGIMDSFLFALALAVGITPELLPIIITIALSSGAIHLARKKVVVKRLVAIEDLGNVDVLCVDKTGTLTENTVSLENYFDVGANSSDSLLELGLVCNSAVLENGKPKGNAIDCAIWERAHKERKNSIENWNKIEEIAFDYERRRMAVVAEKDGKRFLICKGAPESVLSVCTTVEQNGKELPLTHFGEKLRQEFDEWGQKGFRLVALASREIASKKDYSIEDEKQLCFLGFLVFLDPPKKTAVSALEHFQKLGVELKILTGDDPLVTQEVCREVGLPVQNGVLVGSELEKMGESEFLAVLESHNVFARISPEQKYKIVVGLGKNGHIVGFLGDGVNDAPALKAADVGITVNSAVDVARDSADIVLLKKSLLVITDGIREGRKTFGNIIKYIFNTVSANFGNMLTLAISSLFLKFIPLLPSQILLANLVSDAPLMAVSTDNVDEDYLHKPRRWNLKAISNFMVFFGFLSMIFDFITIGVLLLVAQANPATFRTAWFLESVLSEIIITFSIRTKKSFWKSNPSKMLILSSIAAIALTLALLYSPLGFFFQFEALAIPLLLGIGVILLAYLFLGEIAKKRFYQKHEI